MLAVLAACRSGHTHLPRTGSTSASTRDSSAIVADPGTLSLSSGDYVLPRFSPSGRLLAVSQVIADTSSENTQVLIVDLARRSVDTLLTADSAAKYGVYKSYVSDFQWGGDTTLHASIPDGDVGVTELTFDVRSRKIIEQTQEEGGDDDTAPPYRAVAESLARIYPEIAPHGDPVDVFEASLAWPTVKTPSLVLLQHRYHGLDDNVWQYRLDRKDATRVLVLSDGIHASLAGGFQSGGDVVFAVAAGRATLYRYREGQLTTLLSGPAQPQQSSLQVRAQHGDSVWFLLSFFPSYMPGRNEFLMYDGDSLHRLDGNREVADADVYLPGRRAAILVWDHGERHVLVAQLPRN